MLTELHHWRAFCTTKGVNTLSNFLNLLVIAIPFSFLQYNCEGF